MDYGEIICESIKTITNSVLEGIGYDKTLQCTITDDSLREQGTYTVTDGSVSFTAYSENTTYRNNSVVYVTIPNGDYNNDKIITGKKVLGSSLEPFIYNAPFKNLVDITGNLITDNDEGGLIANLPQIYYTPYYGEVGNNYSNYYIQNEDGSYSLATSMDEEAYYEQHTDGDVITLFEQSYSVPYTGFTRLGIQAQFQAWLQQYNCIAGNYGLKLTVQFTPEGSATQNIEERITKVLYLQVADMIGNPYAFESFYNQEKVFDITSLGGISYIKLEFFQEPNSFLNQDGNSLPYTDDFDNLIFSNLFVKDCRVCLGYSIDAYDTEFVQLVSFSQPTFTSKVSAEKNKKEISLKWIHIDEDGNQIQMDVDSPYEYEIRWYRYLLGEQSADIYCGAGWTDPSHERNVEDFIVSDDKFSAILHPDTALIDTEQIKVIILVGPPPEYTLVERISESIFNVRKANYYILQDGQYKNCQFLDFDANETYYTQGEDNRVKWNSNIISFTNENSVINSATLDAIQALTLQCADVIDGVIYDTYGNYLLYDQANALIDKSQASITRIIKAKLDLSSTEIDDTADLVRAESIVWRFPTSNTMIKPLDSYDEETGTITVIDPEKIQQDLTQYGGPIFRYNINMNYSPSRANNTVECIVTIDGVSYHASKELSFGQSGTSGTEWTIAIDFVGNNNCIDLSNTIDRQLLLQVSLQDSSGQLQDISQNSIEWGFLSPADTSETISTRNDMSLIVAADQTEAQLTWNSNVTMNSLCIVYAKIKDWGDYELIAYLPIPIRLNDTYTYLTGATQIIYLTDATPLYYNGIYELHKTSGDPIVLGFKRYCSVSTNGGIENYLPTLRTVTKQKVEQGQQLQPVSLFVEGLPIVAIQGTENNQTVWTQPILMIQNRYPSAMVNSWNGKDLVLDENNGAILSQMVGAGSKNANNQFSGVLMGDWTSNAQASTALNTYTGLYGFKDGQMVFSFRDDGTATIGSATGSQLKFDGNESVIKSGGFSNGNGMQIDFDDGLYEIKRNSITRLRISYTSPFFEIKNSNGQDLIRISDSDNYFYGDITIEPNNVKSRDYSMEVIFSEYNSSIIESHTEKAIERITLGQAIADLQSNTNYSVELARAVETVATTAYSAAQQAKRLAVTTSENVSNLKNINDAFSDMFGFSTASYGQWQNGAFTIYGINRRTNIQLSGGVHINTDGSGLYIDGSGLVTIIKNAISEVNASDKRLKYNINKDNLIQYNDLFFKLQPSEFILNSDKYNTKTLGFIAQDVLKELGDNKAIVRQNLKQENGEYYYSLDYNSITTLNTYMLQEAYKKIDSLEKQIQELKEKIK